MTAASLVKKNYIFFTGCMVFFLALLCVLFFSSKAEGFYMMNTYHNNFLTIVFIAFTCMGDGFFCVAVGLLLFFFKKRLLALMVLGSYALSGIIAQVLKYFVIEARPAVFLQDSSYKYFIKDVTLHNLHSFPSGHTVSAFALAAVLSFAAKNKTYSILFLIVATLVGYSRIYLAQHFLDDVLAGAAIGLFSAIICQVFFEKSFIRLLRPRKAK